MFLKKQKTQPKPIHEIYPDVLFWEIGDTFYWPGNVTHKLLAMKENGECFMEWCGNSEYTKIAHVKDLYGYNERLISKRRNEHKKATILKFNGENYLQYIKDFSTAYKQIKRDLNSD